MFHITLITVGKLKERYYAAAADEYIRRLGAYCKFELIELPECRLPDDPNGTQIAAGLAREAEQIEAKLPRGAWFCVLTPEGTELSSEGLAERLQAEKLNGRSAACFLIGSSFGIDARIKRMGKRINRSFKDCHMPATRTLRGITKVISFVAAIDILFEIAADTAHTGELRFPGIIFPYKYTNRFSMIPGFVKNPGL